MFKLVVLSALVAIAVAKPSAYYHEALVATPVVAKTYVAPAAVSSTYREDVISKPAHVNYVAAAPFYATKALLSAPVVTKTVVAPAAVSHTYREDIVSKPAAVTYAQKNLIAEAVVAKAVVAEPVAAIAQHVTRSVIKPAAVSHTYRKDVIEEPAVLTYSAPTIIQKSFVAGPIAYSAPVAYKLDADHASLVQEW